MEGTLRLNVRFEEDTSFQHPEFTKVSVWVATYGENANKSNISKQAFEKALPSLVNVPIIGEYRESAEDFAGHGGKLVIDDDGVQFIQTTKAYGVIPESCNPRWELDENNVEYLVCDGILWTGRYEEANKVKENKNNQSMEISATNYFTDESNGVLNITDFVFTGICILGEDTTPCFPSAKMVYSFNKEEIKEEFSLLLNEIKKISSKEGGNKVGRDEIIAKFSKLSNHEQYEEIINNTELSDEELEKQLFALSINDLKERVRESLNEITYTKSYPWGDTEELRKYYLEDVIPESNIAICESNEKWYTYFGIPYSEDGDKIILDEANAKRYVRGNWREMDEGSSNQEPYEQAFSDVVEKYNTKINSLMEELNTEKANFEATKSELDELKVKNVDLQTNFTSLEEEAKELREFKANTEKGIAEAEIDDLVKEFTENSNIEEVEGFKEVFENRYSKSKEELESILKIFCFDNGIVLGKKMKESKKANFSLNDNVENNSNKSSDWAFLDEALKNK